MGNADKMREDMARLTMHIENYRDKIIKIEEEEIKSLKKIRDNTLPKQDQEIDPKSLEKVFPNYFRSIAKAMASNWSVVIYSKKITDETERLFENENTNKTFIDIVNNLIPKGVKILYLFKNFTTFSVKIKAGFEPKFTLEEP